jgi:hypothetical protein
MLRRELLKLKRGQRVRYDSTKSGGEHAQLGRVVKRVAGRVMISPDVLTDDPFWAAPAECSVVVPPIGALDQTGAS